MPNAACSNVCKHHCSKPTCNIVNHTNIKLYSIRNFKVSPTTIESGEKAEQQLTCNYSPKLFRPLSSIELLNLTDLSKMKMRRDLRSARSHDEFFNTRGLSHLMNAINMINAVCLRIGLEIHAVFQSEDRCIYMR